MDKNIYPGWEIMEKLGSGAFSTVYKIRKNGDTNGVYDCALKVIAMPSNEDEYNQYKGDGYDDEAISTIYKSQVASLEEELKLLSAFKGTANIVSYEDHSIVPQESGIGYYVLMKMELLSTLPNSFNQKPLTVEDTVKLGEDIAGALMLCEKSNIVHRDIKPQNIFVNKFGDYKLGDFGIARTMDHTTRATKIGTPAYMAPEVFHGNAYNNTADIYSLGMVLYWALNERRLPFLPMPPQVPTAEDSVAAQEKRINGAAIPPPKNGTDALKQVVLKACAFNPAERYATAKELKAALSNALNGVVVPAVPTPDIEKTVAVRKAPAPLPDVEATMAVRKAPQAPIELQEYIEVPQPQEPAPKKESGNKKGLVIALCLLLVVGLGVGAYFMFFGDKGNDDNNDDATQVVNNNLQESTSPSSADAEDSFVEESSVSTDESSVSTDESSVSTDESSMQEESSAPPQQEESSLPETSEPTVEYDAQGTTNNGLTWTLFEGTLTISGKGKMDDSPPWLTYKDDYKTVVISSGITSIGKGAFASNKNLTSISIPSSVTTIGDSAFNHCTALKDLVLPNGVKTIKDYVFYGCNGLTVTLPKSITSISGNAFVWCVGLTANYKGTKAQWEQVDLGVDEKYENGFHVVHCTNGDVQLRLSGLDDEAHRSDPLEWYLYNGALTISGEGEMGYYLAAYASESAWMPHLSNIKSIVIEEGATSVGHGAFSYATSLTSVHLPSSIQYIGEYSFSGCTALTRVNYNGTKAQWNNISLGYDWNYNCPFTVVHCTDGDVVVE